jgi:bisphosphoglycerate-dependent phosphoglycerate mutase
VFAFDRQFDVTYYRALKATYDAGEWGKIVEDIIAGIKTETTKKHGKSTWLPFNSFLLSALSPIYIEERFTDRLFELVKNEKDIDRLMVYHEHLVFSYAHELLQLYIPALERQADKADNRSHYAQLAGNMKKIMRALAFGKEQIIELAKKMKQKYPRRPAMVEELNRVIY